MSDLSLRATLRMLAAITVITLPLSGAGAKQLDASVAIADDSMTTPAAAGAGEETFSASAVMDSDLDSSRGAFLPNTINFNNLSATNIGNSVVGGVTGSNNVTGSSFNNSNGLVNVIQNSGNNVIIQSSTIVNMTFNK